jgi:hypothetical protein
MKRNKKPVFKVVRIYQPKCVKLINIAAKYEVVMAKEVVDRLGTYNLNAMNLIFVGLV